MHDSGTGGRRRRGLRVARDGPGHLVPGALIVATIAGHAPARAVTAALVAIALLIAQLAAVRPRLTRRSDRILAGQDMPRSRSHYAYIALETAKVIALIVTGALLLAT